MYPQTGNLSYRERILSALIGVALPAVLFRRRNPVIRLLGTAAASGLAARAIAGHCGMKSALTGQTTLREGLRDQWRCLVSKGRAGRQALPGSPMYAQTSRAVDESVEESFPASDPPASRLADEPPSNAEAKWAATRPAH